MKRTIADVCFSRVTVEDAKFYRSCDMSTFTGSVAGECGSGAADPRLEWL
jgi:hypothetical protein